MHKIRALCPLIRTETLKKATAGRGREQLHPYQVAGFAFRQKSDLRSS